MTEWIEPNPKVEVQAAEYQRLLGYPAGHMLGGRAKDLAEWARAWYAEHGRPWIYAREAGSIGTGGASVIVEGVRFHSGALRPKKSLLAVFGLTRHTEGVRRLTEMVACENCALPACEFRRNTGKA